MECVYVDMGRRRLNVEVVVWDEEYGIKRQVAPTCIMTYLYFV